MRSAARTLTKALLFLTLANPAFATVFVHLVQTGGTYPGFGPASPGDTLDLEIVVTLEAGDGIIAVDPYITFTGALSLGGTEEPFNLVNGVLVTPLVTGNIAVVSPGLVGGWEAATSNPSLVAMGPATFPLGIATFSLDGGAASFDLAASVGMPLGTTILGAGGVDLTPVSDLSGFRVCEAVSPIPVGQVLNFNFGAGITGMMIANVPEGSVDFDSDGADDVWNAFGDIPGFGAGATVGNGTSGFIEDIDGNQTALTMSISGVSGQDTTSSEIPMPSDWDETILEVPDAAMSGHYFGPLVTFDLDGLVPFSSYQVEVFRAFDAVGVADLSVNGGAACSHDREQFFSSGLDPERARIAFSATADASGRITVLSDRLGPGNSVIDAIRYVPEPSLLASLAPGIALLTWLERRRGRVPRA